MDLFALVADPEQAAEVRIEGLKFLAQVKDWRYASALNLALKDESEPLRIAASKLPGTRFDVSSFAKALESGSIAERQSALASLALTTGQEAELLVTKQVDAVLDGTLPKELQLDVFETAGNRPSLKPKLAAFESGLPKGDALNARLVHLDQNRARATYHPQQLNAEGRDLKAVRKHDDRHTPDDAVRLRPDREQSPPRCGILELRTVPEEAGELEERRLDVNAAYADDCKSGLRQVVGRYR